MSFVINNDSTSAYTPKVVQTGVCMPANTSFAHTKQWLRLQLPGPPFTFTHRLHSDRLVIIINNRVHIAAAAAVSALGAIRHACATRAALLQHSQIECGSSGSGRGVLHTVYKQSLRAL
jgi:hypothetical protein